MKINSVGTVNNIYNNKTEKSNNQHQSAPNFKGLMDIPGIMMNGIEKGGFIASFLIQDTLGMTVPRTREGLHRGVNEDDQKKKTSFKDLNFKEGAEVLIREGLSGPFMMFTPVLVLLLGRKFAGKSSFTNSRLIKRLGKNMTELVKGESKDSVNSLKSAFYKKNIESMVKATTPTADASKEASFVEKAVASVEKLDSYDRHIAEATGKRKSILKKAQKREKNNLLNMFNEYHKSNSSDYNMVNRVKLDGEVFSTEKAINGMRDYVQDTVKGKNVADITPEYTEKLQKKSLISRAVVNALAAASTIGSLSIVPMLYKLVNPVPPGALGAPNQANAEKSPEKVETPAKENKNNGNVSFTGRYDKFAKFFEFNGNQLTPALMTSLAAGGLIAPRVKTAAKRAPEDSVTKKKDYSEIPEILVRDIVSTGAVTFGVPMLSKALVSSYENSTGFVLQNRPEKPLKGIKKVLDMMNPFSANGPFGISDLDQMYGNIDSHAKLNTFSQYINNNDGNLAKIFKTEKRVREVFTEHGLNIDELAKGDKKASNTTIMNKIADSEFAQKLIDAIKPEKANKANKLLKRARTLNSVTSFASTVFLVPAFLGMVLPRLVYGMTERRQAKMAAAKQQQNNVAQVQEPAKQENNNIDYSKLRTNFSSQTFTRMKNA